MKKTTWAAAAAACTLLHLYVQASPAPTPCLQSGIRQLLPVTAMADGIYTIRSLQTTTAPVITGANETALQLSEAYLGGNQVLYRNAVIETTGYIPLELEKAVQTGLYINGHEALNISLTPGAFGFTTQFFGGIPKKVKKTALLVVRQKAFIVELGNTDETARQVQLICTSTSSYQNIIQAMPEPAVK
jgi:hypothetical protein